MALEMRHQTLEAFLLAVGFLRYYNNPLVQRMEVAGSREQLQFLPGVEKQPIIPALFLTTPTL